MRLAQCITSFCQRTEHGQGSHCIVFVTVKAFKVWTNYQKQAIKTTMPGGIKGIQGENPWIRELSTAYRVAFSQRIITRSKTKVIA